LLLRLLLLQNCGLLLLLPILLLLLLLLVLLLRLLLQLLLLVMRLLLVLRLRWLHMLLHHWCRGHSTWWQCDALRRCQLPQARVLHLQSVSSGVVAVAKGKEHRRHCRVGAS
jgi:hypothetical protein